ncbi:glucosamine/galactosamine-6-phosphate isomerase [Emticicia oligotrophica DSM 17448]|uniref:Glucosamine/galactosamine-6-phosphate isomerase n=1 Tax=Emticicia oligotrophica (strain DSM 17448 / CIP 109782 / MTCC 6937 / GPTSA100-15) TaxID=929562 RepID=A0ABM5N6V2_EMTOG|nr:glucosamine-6-phosphate deaminase [Emticicia oligotrophica]AFK05284.1 glucosamine/galactosamine-6-phosphate isomerase [Emticicia oligotrophica DSM 17448]
MQIDKFENAEKLALHTANYIIELVKNKPNATLILTSGDTPVITYRKIVELANPKDFAQVTIIGLDEWVGVPSASEGSCRFIVEENLLKPLGINESQFTFFDSMSNDLQNECKRVDDLLFSKGGADLMLVGVGVNGHIGLNEPGTSFDKYCHVSELAEITISIGQKYFKQSTQLTQGITIGLKHLLEAKSAVLIATGERKAEVLKTLVESEPNVDFPATVFKLHSNSYVWIDESAAQLL